jgi:hypothetical protein
MLKRFLIQIGTWKISILLWTRQLFKKNQYYRYQQYGDGACNIPPHICHLWVTVASPNEILVSPRPKV